MKKELTLLQKAKARTSTRKLNLVTDEVIELSIAWARGEILYAQAQEVLTGKRTGMNAYGFLARGLRDYIRKHKI